MRIFPYLSTALLFIVSTALPASPKVVASIVPVHSLVSAVIQDVGEAHLLLPGGASPHDYVLRPSAMRMLQQADIVFWVGPELESTLIRPLNAVHSTVRAETLLRTAELNRLPLREGGVWESEQHEHSHRHSHEHSGDHQDAADWDAHIWLDPNNAQLIVAHIAAALSELDPLNRDQYQANAKHYQQRINQLQQQLVQDLEPVRQTPYIVFHDAYQYFENAFGLQAVGAITLHPDRQPGAQRIQAIRSRIMNNQVRCVFSEPQFRPALVQTLIADTNSQSAILDPLGANLAPGTEAYLALLRNLTQALISCLTH